jgi:hypothetical protein
MEKETMALGKEVEVTHYEHWNIRK